MFYWSIFRTMSPMFYIISFFAVLLVSSNISVEAAVVGVYYGRVGDNLPSPTAVVNLLRSKNVDKVCLTSPNSDALDALRRSGIEVVLVIQNYEVLSMADPDYAGDWVYKNVLSFSDVRFRYISVGNEVNFDDAESAESRSILPAMNNIRNALGARGITIPVCTTISFGLVKVSYPPSSGRFSDAAQSRMQPIVRFLEDTGAPLLVNIYPYFSYVSNPQIGLDYTLFTANQVVVTDNGFQYSNLFDAMMDATYAAIDRVGGFAIDGARGSNVALVVKETGYPSGPPTVITESGRPSAQTDSIETISNAQTYVNNLISHVSGINGTPRRPGRSIETYIFALFNENQKQPAIEQHFGLYYPDMSPVYPVTFR